MKSRNESEKTRKMHKNFNDRSIFQVLIQFLFSTIPFTIVNCLLYFNIIIPEVSYFADIMAELMPLACVFTLFVFYEPYQHFLLLKMGLRHERSNILSTTGALEKGGVKLVPKHNTVH
uniref:7TM_GPCR_Srx domain-containing protein n=2 Tax=Caenorhabditis tropicalis TaxID=1561998 RepID=A0A1I7T9Z2_9PELO